MPGQISATVPPSERVRELLLDYLRAGLNWPGADGVTLEEVLLSYPSLAASGRVPDREELMRRHPELTAELEVYFALADRIERT